MSVQQVREPPCGASDRLSHLRLNYKECSQRLTLSPIASRAGVCFMAPFGSACFAIRARALLSVYIFEELVGDRSRNTVGAFVRGV
jgi:hypothetical protein